MSINTRCHNESSLFFRFYDHCKMAFVDNLGKGRAPENYLEQAGDAFLEVGYLPYRALKHIGRKIQDPRYITVAATALALLANNYVFYPEATKQAVETTTRLVWDYVKSIDLVERARLISCITSCVGIAGYGLRAEGRFLNTELMNQFYGTRNGAENPAGMTNREILQVT